MLETPVWREVESEVDWPRRWIGLAVLTSFLVIGVIGLLTIGQTAPDATTRWIVRAIMGGFALLGAAGCPTAIARVVSPARVRHAAPEVLPNVPREPVVVEGAIVHGRLTHELVEEPDGWQLRPAAQQSQSDRRLLLGFGVPFLILFAGLLSWIFHGEFNLGGWLAAICCGTFVTLVCGGSVFYLIGMLIRAGNRRLSRLSIPRNGADLELDSAAEPDPDKMDLIAGLRWVFVGDTARRHLAIPRGFMKAVQLCPWKVVIGQPRRSQDAWAVQGLLVVADSSNREYLRLPLLLTGDFAGGARLMERLAATLRVPYLFGADAEGIAAEKIRAKSRPALRIGGTQS